MQFSRWDVDSAFAHDPHHHAGDEVEITVALRDVRIELFGGEAGDGFTQSGLKHYVGQRFEPSEDIDVGGDELVPPLYVLRREFRGVHVLSVERRLISLGPSALKKDLDAGIQAVQVVLDVAAGAALVIHVEVHVFRQLLQQFQRGLGRASYDRLASWGW